MLLTDLSKAVVGSARRMKFGVRRWLRAVSRYTTFDLSKKTLHERFEEWEAAADDGNVEFEAGPDGFLGAGGWTRLVRPKML